jgi:ribosomal protein S18 acetylase RimI-like enzyme
MEYRSGRIARTYRHRQFYDRCVIRDLVLSDIPAVKGMLEHWMRDKPGAPVRSDNVSAAVAAMERSVTVADPSYVVFEVDGHVVGVAGCTATNIDPSLTIGATKATEIMNVYVRPDHVGRGIGTAMVDEVERRLCNDGFDMIVIVSGSRNERYGYPFWNSRYGERFQTDTDYFGPGTERVVWRKMLG